MICRIAFCLTCVAAASVAGPSAVCAQGRVDVAVAWQNGAPAQYVLLENGNVLAGQVRLIDGHYHLEGEGSELRLPASVVRFIEPSIELLYLRQCEQQPQPSLAQRLKRADWCGRQQLWDHAVRELLAAQQKSPADPRVSAAQRRLWLARENALRQTAADTAQLADGHVTDGHVADEHVADGQVIDQSVQPATYVESVAETPLNQPLGILPDGALQQFTRKIQPILVNNCTLAGCHAPQGPQKFQLNRDLLRGLATRRSTDANLASALSAIDSTNPDASPLITAMQPSHAGGRGPRLGVRRDDLRLKVRDWARLVAAAEPPPNTLPEPAATEPPPAPLGKPPTPLGKPKPSEDVYAPGYYEALLLDESSKPIAQPPAVKRGLQLKPVDKPRDEFDPEIFNRQLRRASAQSSSGS